MTCKICGGTVTATDPDAYPYCSVCHYTGRAAEAQREEQLKWFGEQFPAAEVRIDHTGGGCFWLAVQFPDEKRFYVATDGEASLPKTPRGGWGYVGRHSDNENDPDFDGTPIVSWLDPDDGAERYTDEQVVAAIRGDREEEA